MRTASALLLSVVSLTATGCGDIFGFACTTELRSPLSIAVHEAATGAPAALEVTGFARHRSSGFESPLYSAGHDTWLHGNWDRERAGRYDVQLRRPGYLPYDTSVNVPEDRCHITPQSIEARLVEDPAAERLEPIAVDRGPTVQGMGSAVGILVRGDTLILTGRSYSNCADIEPVAYRNSGLMHVQLQPLTWSIPNCAPYTLQQLSVKYLLRPGTTNLYVTHVHGYLEHPVLFDGRVVAGAASGN